VHRELARAVREHVAALLLAVLRVSVHHRLAQASVRQLERLEPKSFDLNLPWSMVGEEMAGDGEVFSCEP